jgi:acyl-CoA reductase-like NAD-dependent aldehyde dehydrogenase
MLTGVGNDMGVAREESFGSVAALIPFDTEADFIRVAKSFELAVDRPRIYLR